MLLSKLVDKVKKDLSCFNRERTLDAYTSVLNSVLAFAGYDPKVGEVFEASWIMQYQLYLIAKGLKWNTISFYMRMLRSIHNKGIAGGYHVTVTNLFLHAYTGLAATVKRAVLPNLIHRILHGKVSASLEFCRDIFVLCFHLQGMAFVDLAYLKKSDIVGNNATYRRRKSGSFITTPINDEALRILKKYAHLVKDVEYAFPIITDPTKDARLQYESALRAQNRNLKKLARELNIEVNLTTYVARHSWASMAFHNNVSMRQISAALGHKTEEITQIYLSSLGVEELIKANEAIAQALEREAEKERQRELEQEKERRREAERTQGGAKETAGNEGVRHLAGDGQESGANV
jgi:integrase